MSLPIVVLGAGAAGLMCALQAGRRGHPVVLIEHNDRIGRKILISGGGRCNFTNTSVSAKNYVSGNAHFCKSALSRFESSDFVALVEAHGIGYHEKKLGQLFCDKSAREIVAMLEEECREANVEIRLSCVVKSVSKESDGSFAVETSAGRVPASRVVIATGGLSIPQIGATEIGYRIARHFGLKVTPLTPALDGFTVKDELAFLTELSGISLDVTLSCLNGISFRENILFTHAGLSGPAALQGSLHWKRGESITLDLLPELDVLEWLMQEKRDASRKQLKNLLGEKLTSRFAELFCEHYHPGLGEACQAPDKALKALASRLKKWEIFPSGTVGYNKAEVTKGGVDTDELSSKTMESKKVPGLYFIGEVVDVTGWLGGFNFQWAWASASAAAEAF
ncbi:MAG: NAD(P)/FAD-dependent oxidoreductase [Bdellovibrionota bacterium]